MAERTGSRRCDRDQWRDNYSAWLQRNFQYKGFRTPLAPTNGSMGYGVPAAVAAKLTAPDRMVIAFAGDGCFLMNGQELATAAQYWPNVIFVAVNNCVYGDHSHASGARISLTRLGDGPRQS
jgi:thiamine pyrophosphate-dependent acetolactate synthase large subunit-like protein